MASGQLIGEVCIPKELVLPTIPFASQNTEATGQFFISSNALYHVNGSTINRVADALMLKVPAKTTSAVAGELFLSSSKLYFYTGSAVERITSV